MAQIKASLPEAIDSQDIIEIDEMWHYTQKKRQKLWVWIAVSRLTRRILAIETGSRGQKPLRKLWSRIRHLKPFAVA
ncbi:MAG: IS1 family transposase, partial [Sphaerospermopsis sp. SIO1G2]|nr:IS1 family transposase [Sphaerospermopsis sp. SIO1G2]